MGSQYLKDRIIGDSIILGYLSKKSSTNMPKIKIDGWFCYCNKFPCPEENSSKNSFFEKKCNECNRCFGEFQSNNNLLTSYTKFDGYQINDFKFFWPLSITHKNIYRIFRGRGNYTSKQEEESPKTIYSMIEPDKKELIDLIADCEYYLRNENLSIYEKYYLKEHILPILQNYVTHDNNTEIKKALILSEFTEDDHNFLKSKKLYRRNYEYILDELLSVFTFIVLSCNSFISVNNLSGGGVFFSDALSDFKYSKKE